MANKLKIEIKIKAYDKTKKIIKKLKKKYEKDKNLFSKKS